MRIISSKLANLLHKNSEQIIICLKFEPNIWA
jgi:hypothetical protein